MNMTGTKICIGVLLAGGVTPVEVTTSWMEKVVTSVTEFVSCINPTLDEEPPTTAYEGQFPAEEEPSTKIEEPFSSDVKEYTDDFPSEIHNRDDNTKISELSAPPSEVKSADPSDVSSDIAKLVQNFRGAN